MWSFQVGPDFQGYETAVQKFNRLTQELTELSQQVEELKKVTNLTVVKTDLATFKFMKRLYLKICQQWMG